MNDLIKITPTAIEGRSVQTVNARGLHAFLESKQRFADWIKGRIRQYDFKKGSDFVVFDNSVKNPNGGRSTEEYHITIDMALTVRREGIGLLGGCPNPQRLWI